MINSSEFTKRLQKILDYYELNATEFAEKIEFNRSTISHLISGRNNPSLEFVMKVLQKFPEVSLDWLVSGKGSFPNSGEGTLPPSAVKKDAPDLFSEIDKPSGPTIKNVGKKIIDRIIIFYSDGTFSHYEN